MDILWILFHGDLSRKHINIDAALAKDMNSVMAVENGSIRPRFEAISQTRHERRLQASVDSFSNWASFGALNDVSEWSGLSGGFSGGIGI